MEYLSAKLANYILKKGLIDTEAYEIYQYGFQCFLEVSVSTICSLFLALLLHMNVFFSSYYLFHYVHLEVACI